MAHNFTLKPNDGTYTTPSIERIRKALAMVDDYKRRLSDSETIADVNARRVQKLLCEIEDRDKKIAQLEVALKHAHRAVDSAVETIERQKLGELGKPHGHDS